jgi:hypothetical protein
MLWSGEWAKGWQTHGSLERGGVPPEGASSPRAKRSPAQGGIQPSSEAEFRPRGRPTLERGRVSPEGASSPRARRSFARGVPGPAACWAAEFAWVVGSCCRAVIV